MPELKPILLAEDSPRDAELTLEALADNKLANRVMLNELPLEGACPHGQ